MSKFTNSTTLYDDCKTLSISDLKRFEHLKPNKYKTSHISWTRNGETTGTISILSNTHPESPYLEFDYKYYETPIKYRVQLVAIPSNLGKGCVWFFICPRTGKRCRKLHLADTFFYHRSAFKGCLYKKQTLSHKNRKLGKQFERFFGIYDASEKIYSKNFRTQYAGKPTKNYLILINKIKEANNISEMEFMRLLRG